MARQAAQRVAALQGVVSITAQVTSLASHVRFALTLSGNRVAGSTRYGSDRTAVAGHANSASVRTVELRDASVAEKALHAVFALALACKRVAELVEGAVWVAVAGNAPVRMSVIEELKAIVAAVTG